MITPENLVKHELTGLEVEIAGSSNKSMISIKGRVIDESRQMLTIKTVDGEKKVPKALCSFIFTLPEGKKVKVDGELLVSRPEDRIKKKFRKW